MNVAALVLAAGAGQRFGGGKLTAPFRGEPLLSHALRAACAAPVERVVVVAPPDLPLGTLMRSWPDTPQVEVVRLNSSGLAQSLKAGIAAAQAESVLVFLGDMPLIPHDVAAWLIAALGDNYAAVPCYGQAMGHPVLLSARACADVAGLEGDRGAGALLRSRADVVRIAVASPGIVQDVDSPDDLAALEREVTPDRQPPGAG